MDFCAGEDDAVGDRRRPDDAAPDEATGGEAPQGLDLGSSGTRGRFASGLGRPFARPVEDDRRLLHRHEPKPPAPTTNGRAHSGMAECVAAPGPDQGEARSVGEG